MFLRTSLHSCESSIGYKHSNLERRHRWHQIEGPPNFKMKFLPPFLALLTLARATAPPSKLNASHPIPDIARHHFHTRSIFKSIDVPRLVMYVQTFTTKDNRPLSLLPLLEHQTRVTHIILASAHLHESPGEIRLNDDPFDAGKYDHVWKEVKILQEAGVKVSILLGGAAAGTYKNLNGTDDEVYPILSSVRSQRELTRIESSSTHTTTPYSSSSNNTISTV
jgi:hypothetical protein